MSMFRKQNVYAVVLDFGVRVKDERQQDRNHLVEVGLEVAMTYDLADEILPAMARDLFMSVRGEMQPRPEMQEAIFTLSPSQQVMEVRTHPDLPCDIRVKGVTLRRIKAVKAEAGVWMLRFTAGWVLGNPTEVALMIQRLKLGVYITLIEQQPALPVDGVVDTTATPAGEKPKKTRKGKKNPEGERNLQLVEGQRMLEAGDAVADPDPDQDAAPAAGEPADPEPDGDPADDADADRPI